MSESLRELESQLGEETVERAEKRKEEMIKEHESMKEKGAEKVVRELVNAMDIVLVKEHFSEMEIEDLRMNSTSSDAFKGNLRDKLFHDICADITQVMWNSFNGHNFSVGNVGVK